MSDYLAIIPIGAGSSWGRAADKEAAIQNAVRSLKDWMELFEVADRDVMINVIDVDGFDRVVWGVNGISGQREGAGDDAEFETIDRPIETVTRHTPKWKRKRS